MWNRSLFPKAKQLSKFMWKQNKPTTSEDVAAAARNKAHKLWLFCHEMNNIQSPKYVSYLISGMRFRLERGEKRLCWWKEQHWQTYLPLCQKPTSWVMSDLDSGGFRSHSDKNVVKKKKFFENCSLQAAIWIKCCCCVIFWLCQKLSLLMLLPLCAAVLSSGSGLEWELFGMGMWSLGLGAVGAALAGIFLANTDLCLSKAANATLEYLEGADLRSTTEGI